MSSIQPFDFEGTPVRTITYETGVTWWVLADVVRSLELTSPTRVAERLDPDGVSQTQVIDSMGREQTATIVNESGLYEVILRSDKPEAKRFRKWVTSEVLPSIRRHGAYMTSEVIERTLTNPDYLIALATQLKQEQERREAAEIQSVKQAARIDMLEPKAQALDDLTSTEHLYTLTEAAQLLNNGGDGFGLKRLTNWLRTNKWIRRENRGNAPYQDKIDSGLLTTKAYKARFNPENGDYQTFTPKILVTAKGVARLYKQIYGIDKASMEQAA